MKTFPRVLLALLSLLLVFLLAASLLVSAGIYTVRRTLSPAFVENTVEGLDYASVRFPDGWGGFTTLLDEFNDALGWYGITFTAQSLNEMVRTLSFDVLLKDYLEGFRAWLFEYGPKPYLDPDEAARTVLSGVDQSAVNVLSLFMDLQDLVAENIALFTDSTQTSARLDSLETLRTALSRDTLLFAFTVAAVLFLLLSVSRRLRVLPTLTLTGLSAALAGGCMSMAPTLLARQKNALLVDLSMPESTLDIVYRPLMARITSNGSLLLFAGLALAAVAGLAWLLTGRGRKIKNEE
ncbi:MAG: hypothetical protein IKZ41_11475 [Clostridia bacterium]|nr:hypothetical protein [Clostridia bacterium]MBR5364891.1 hypothetical protein [Clostridia bacterium]